MEWWLREGDTFYVSEKISHKIHFSSCPCKTTPYLNYYVSLIPYRMQFLHFSSDVEQKKVQTIMQKPQKTKLWFNGRKS